MIIVFECEHIILSGGQINFFTPRNVRDPAGRQGSSTLNNLISLNLRYNRFVEGRWST